MTFKDLLSALGKLPCDEIRANREGYFEAVIATASLTSFQLLLGTYFGKPLKAADEKATPEAIELSLPYGGIESDQIMYFHKIELGYEIAMLWPWGSGLALTLKVIHERHG